MERESVVQRGPELDLPPGEPESAAEKVVRKTPWWAISMGLHTALALLLGLFWAVQAAPEDFIPLANLSKQRPDPPVMYEDPVKSPVPIEIPVKAETTMVSRQKDPEPESAEDQEFKKMKGQSEDFVTQKPFNSKSVYDVIGPGGGAAGRKGGPFGGRFNRFGQGSGSPKPCDDAVLEALKWLARHQSADGAWGVQGYLTQCGKIHSGSCTPNPASAHADFDAGVTGLSLLAFLGAGYTHLSRDVHDGICFGDVVRKGLQWLMSHQDPEGCVGSRNVQKYMYNHTICALALCEAFGLTGSNLFKDQAQKAVDFTVAAQNPGLGWRYGYKCGDNDTSVTGWAVMALKSAELSLLSVPAAGYDGTRRWFDQVCEKSYSRAGYTHEGTGKVYIPGLNENYDHHESMSAIVIMGRIFMDKNPDDARLKSAAGLLLNDLPRFDGNNTDFYYWYYASLALFQLDGPKGPLWSRWNKSLIEALVKPQNRAAGACRNGSWEPVDRWSCEGGRVYATAINALTLEVYYRYASVFIGKNYR